MSKSKRSGYERLDEKKDEIRYEKINKIEIITNLNKRNDDGERVKEGNINYDINNLIGLLNYYKDKRNAYEKKNENNIKFKNKIFYKNEIDKIDKIDYKYLYVPVNFKLDEKLLKKNVYGFYAMFNEKIMDKLLENQKSKIIDTDKGKNKSDIEEKIFIHNVKIYIDLLFIVNNLIKINNLNYTITKSSYDKKSNIKKADILIKLNVSTYKKSTSDKKEKTCETRLYDIKQLYRGLYQGLVGIDVKLSPDEEEIKKLDILISKSNKILFIKLKKIYEEVFGKNKKDKKLKGFTRGLYSDIDINLTSDENVAMFRTDPKQYIEYIKLSNILSLKKTLEDKPDSKLNNDDRQLIIIDTLKKVKKEKERQKTLQKKVREDLRRRLSSKTGGGKEGTQIRQLRRHTRRKRTRKQSDSSTKKRLDKRSIYHHNNNNNNNYGNSIRKLIENNNILSKFIRNTLENNNNNINEHDYILNNNGKITKKKYTKKGCGKVIYKQFKNKATRRNLQKIKQLFNSHSPLKI